MTLLGLLIGFTFSMAMSRYEQRKNYEEAEANAIGNGKYVCAGSFLASRRRQGCMIYEKLSRSAWCGLTPSAMRNVFSKSMPLLPSCRTNSGPPSRLAL